MKKLGLVFGLLVSASSLISASVFAESSDEIQQKLSQKMTVALDGIEAVQPTVELKAKSFEPDQTLVLEEVNLVLEQKMDKKLEALLASQLQSLETEALAQN